MSPTAVPPSLRDAYARCEALANRRIENFPVLSSYISKEHAHHLAAVYAFCRMADDAADESASPAAALDTLTTFRRFVDLVFEGTEVDRGALPPEFQALSATVAGRRLPRIYFTDLLDAFVQDQTQTRHDSLESLLNYSKKSANPVGRLVLATVGEELTNEKLEASDLICTGLQLANFWQDVAVDYSKNRVYIPRDYMERHGVPEQDIARGVATPAFRAMLAELCHVTDPMFVRGARLGRLVGPRLRIPILAFAIAGRELLQRIRAVDYDIFTKRPGTGSLPLRRILVKAAAARFFGLFDPTNATVVSNTGKQE